VAGPYGAGHLPGGEDFVYRADFDQDRPYEREFDGIRHFEPVSRAHESQLDILQVGRGDGYFYYVMELADDANAECGVRNAECRMTNPRAPPRMFQPSAFSL
jgi:hypothetical protein